MARPRQFDEDVALDSAMGAFWEKGYEATSLADLMSATGLAKASLYNSLGDKHTIFLRTLERFMKNGRKDLEDLVVQEGTGGALLRQWLEHIVAMATCQGVRRGCFMVNSAVELAPHDKDVRALLQKHEQRMESHYIKLLERGIEDGSLRADLDVAQTAQWITTVVYGTQVRGKLAISQNQGDSTVDLLISALEAR